MEKENQSLGSQLREVRKLKKLSLREVETETGVSNPYLSQLETGKINKPSPQVLYKLSNYYCIDYHLLMECAGYAGPKKNTSGPKTLAGAALFAKDLTEEEEGVLVKFLEVLRDKKK